MREARGNQDNKLELWGDAPRYEYSTVPLMKADGGKPVSNPKAGSRGHALMLNDKQVCSLPWIHHDLSAVGIGQPIVSCQSLHCNTSDGSGHRGILRSWLEH